MGAPDLNDFLEVMQRRGYLLAELGDEELTKPALEDRLDVSRSTIDRGIRELESLALVERTDDGFRQTLPGKLAFREYSTFTRSIAGLSGSSSLLASLSRDVTFDVAMLRGGRIVEADRTNPHRPEEELYGLVESASDVRAFAPALHPQQVETYCRKVEAGMSLEVVLAESAVERLLTKYEEDFRRLLAAEDVTVLQAAGNLPYGLTVARTETGPVAVISVYAENGGRGCVLNDTAEAVAWAERRYDSERGRAKELGSRA